MLQSQALRIPQPRHQHPNPPVPAGSAPPHPPAFRRALFCSRTAVAVDAGGTTTLQPSLNDPCCIRRSSSSHSAGCSSSTARPRSHLRRGWHRVFRPGTSNQGATRRMRPGARHATAATRPPHRRHQPPRTRMPSQVDLVVLPQGHSRCAPRPSRPLFGACGGRRRARRSPRGVHLSGWLGDKVLHLSH